MMVIRATLMAQIFYMETPLKDASKIYRSLVYDKNIEVWTKN